LISISFTELHKFLGKSPFPQGIRLEINKRIIFKIRPKIPIKIIIISIDINFLFISDLALTTEYDFKNNAIKYPNAANTMKYTKLLSKRNILYLLLHALFPLSLALFIEIFNALVIFSIISGVSIFVLLIYYSTILLGSFLGYSHCLKNEETKYIPKESNNITTNDNF